MLQAESTGTMSTVYIHRDGYRYIALGLLLFGTLAPLVDLVLWLLGHGHEQPDLGHFVVPPVCVLLGVWCILSMLNTRVTLSDTDLVMQDWKKAKKRIPLDSITGVVWRHPNASCYPALSVEVTGTIEEGQHITVTRWAMAVFAARVRDAIISCLDFSQISGPSGGTAQGEEEVIYRANELEGEIVLQQAKVRRQELAPTVYWPFRNRTQYVFLIGWPLLVVAGLSALLTVYELAMVPADSWADYLYPQLGFLPLWGIVIWQVLESVNTSVIFTDTNLIRQSWLRSRMQIPWNSITAVIWRPQKVGLGWGVHFVLEVEITESSGSGRRVGIAGGVAGEGQARRIRDAIISIRGFSNVPQERRSVGHYGEEIIWRE